jgi:hypothetical protein
MAHYHASLQTSLSCQEAFAYLSDFSTTQDWDPGVVEAHPLEAGEVREGSQFRLLARFLGRSIPLTYTVVEYVPTDAVGLLGENGTVVSRDRITFEPAGTGTRIVYDADLALKGPLRIADPLLGLAFSRVGDRALEGLRRRLGELAASGTPTVEA